VDYITSFHGILETLKASPVQVKLFVASGEGSHKQGPRVRDILDLAKKKGIPVERATQALLDRIDPDNKGIALANLGGNTEKKLSLEDYLEGEPEKGLVVILDHIEDPQNFGAILRSATHSGRASWWRRCGAPLPWGTPPPGPARAPRPGCRWPLSRIWLTR